MVSIFFQNSLTHIFRTLRGLLVSPNMKLSKRFMSFLLNFQYTYTFFRPAPEFPLYDAEYERVKGKICDFFNDFIGKL